VAISVNAARARHASQDSIDPPRRFARLDAAHQTPQRGLRTMENALGIIVFLLLIAGVVFAWRMNDNM
jgi:hypothetical protein